MAVLGDVYAEESDNGRLPELIWSLLERQDRTN